MDVFFDTEFTTLDPLEGYPALISIACVAQDGREFYAELNDTWQPGNCSTFVLDTVLPLLQGGDCRMSEAQCALRLKVWIENLTNAEVTLRSDSPRHDWRWIAELFQFYGCWPKNLRKKCGTIYFYSDSQAERFNEALERFWKIHEKQRHNSLVDARVLYSAWRHAAGRNV